MFPHFKCTNLKDIKVARLKETPCISDNFIFKP